MFAHPPQQQIHPYHLALSLLLLGLTIYPHLFNYNGVSWSVAAYSSDDFDLRHNFLEKFDILDGDDVTFSRSVSKRSSREEEEQLLHESIVSNIKGESRHKSNQFNAIPSTSEYEPLKKIQFSSLGQRFNLVLSKPSHLITDDFSIITLDANGKPTKFLYNRDNIQILNGFVDGDSKSSATASFDVKDKLMTAHIKTGPDTIIVEPTHLHQHHLWSSSNESNALHTKLYNRTMIVYNLRDHRQFGDNSTQDEHLYDSTKLCMAVNVSDFTQDTQNTLKQRQNTRNGDTADISKFEQNKLKRGIEFWTESSKERTRCTLHLVADYLFYKNVGNGDLQTTINYLLALINRVNQIYLPTTWETGDTQESFTNIGFTVQNITIHQEFTQLSSDDPHYNMQNDFIWSAREFLDNFSQNSPPKHYCLAHLLTYRQFNSPVLGLAYVASARHGTIGGICSQIQQRGHVMFKHNTGISTSKGISGETLITRQADLVLAHELGHNLGAEHDSNECRPVSSNGGAYLMHPYAVMGFEKNNRFLSMCSKLSIGRVIRRKASTCFVSVVSNVCGNGVVEEDEECDGGDVGHGHNDPCCDMSCRFTPGSQCSDRHSWCCAKCRIVPAGRPCRPAEEFNCKQASTCDGRSSDCPSPPPVEDNKICVGRGLCRNGDCIPFCESRELHSCLCTTQPDACKLCCKSTINGTCVPYDIKAPYLPDGVLCYRGVCEKGRCEQPIQDVIERLWDVIEDINFSTLVKFLRDNIILVVLALSIPTWCIFSHLINEFDKRIKKDVVSAIMKYNKGRKTPPGLSPFLPRLFVGDELTTDTNLADGSRNEASPLRPPLKLPQPTNGNRFFAPTYNPEPGFIAPNPGFRLPEGERVVIEPRDSIVLNDILVRQQRIAGDGTNDDANNDQDPIDSYSTQV